MKISSSLLLLALLSACTQESKPYREKNQKFDSMSEQYDILQHGELIYKTECQQAHGAVLDDKGQTAKSLKNSNKDRNNVLILLFNGDKNHQDIAKNLSEEEKNAVTSYVKVKQFERIKNSLSTH